MEAIDRGYSLEQHVEGESRHLGASLLRLDLNQEREELLRDAVWATRGHVAKTLVKYPDLRVVLIALKQGQSLGEHHTQARFTVQTLTGRVLLKWGPQSVELSQGCLLAMEAGIPHDVEALQESSFLLTLAWPAGHREA